MPSSFTFRSAGAPGFGSGEVSPVYRLVDSCCDDSCCDDSGPDATGAAAAAPAHKGRARLQQLHPHLHCSVIGTCLGTAELRKAVARLTDVDVTHASDLEIHHEGVTLAGDRLGGKALTKLLDKRHEAAIQAFGQAKDADALAARWQEALHSGAVPGAYWALMSHRHATPALRQRAFGEVHMLSHLVGAANRADIRRLAALEAENSEWRERAQDLQARLSEALEQRDESRRACEALRKAGASTRRAEAAPDADGEVLRTELQQQTRLVALQAQRREAAEQSLASALAQQQALQADADRMRQLNETLTRELHVAGSYLRALAEPEPDKAVALAHSIAGWTVLYVGGRPGSTPAIRKLVTDSGAVFVHHDGGLEDRKGLLDSALAGASVVVFPVDCVDHDSVARLKRLCARYARPFVPLRTASVTSFASAIASFAADAQEQPGFRVCLRHG